METEVWAKFDTEFGAEPPLRPAQDVLADGRRALRRRRVAVGAGAFAAAAVAAVALGQLTGDPTGSVEPADQPSPTPTRTLSSAALAEQKLTAAVPVDTSWQQECGGAAQPTCEAYQEDLTLDRAAAGRRPGPGERRRHRLAAARHRQRDGQPGLRRRGALRTPPTRCGSSSAGTSMARQ